MIKKIMGEIRINSLRIGSLLKSDTGFICRVVKIDNWVEVIEAEYESFYGGVFHEYVIEDKEQLSPIKITGAQLLNIGFEQKLVGSIYEYKGIIVNIFKKGSIMVRVRLENNEYYPTLVEVKNPPKYIHDIKNLFYVINGYEIPYDLKKIK